MRSGIWILAMSSIVGLTGAVNAADTDSDKEARVSRYRALFESKKASESKAVRRYSRDRAAAVKNYRKFFEDDDAAKSKTAAESKEDEVRHADHKRSSESGRDTKVRQVRGNRKAAPKPPVYRAEHRSRSGRRNNVRQVRSLKSDAPLPSVDVSTAPAAPVKSAAPKRTLTGKSTGTPVVKLQWQMHGDINVGQECECSLLVSNSGRAAANDVIVEATFPVSVRLLSAQPKPTDSIERLVWEIPRIEAGESIDIRIRMVPSIPGELATSANVRFSSNSIASFNVEEPRLLVKLKGPEQAVVGDPATHMVTVSNPGTGVAQNVVLEASIPAGLEHSKGSNLSIGVGSLGPGESRSVRLAMAAVSGGEHIVLVQAQADAGLKQRAASSIKVIAPSLDVKIDGPSLRYINRRGSYKLTVINDGGAASNNVRVYHEIPEGFEFVKASNGGKTDSSGKGITWYVGHLDSGQSVDLSVELLAKTIGDFEHHVRVTADEGSHKEVKLATSVEGSAALVMVVDDRDDPIEIGTETWIEARVENRGSKAAANMGISIELPTGVELIDAEGPSTHIAENGLLVFKSIDELQPAETVTYRLRVIGQDPGNMRFRARLTSDSIQQPLIVEELTKFYGE